jgi:hypothetical protein
MSEKKPSRATVSSQYLGSVGSASFGAFRISLYPYPIIKQKKMKKP